MKTVEQKEFEPPKTQTTLTFSAPNCFHEGPFRCSFPVGKL